MNNADEPMLTPEPADAETNDNANLNSSPSGEADNSNGTSSSDHLAQPSQEQQQQKAPVEGAKTEDKEGQAPIKSEDDKGKAKKSKKDPVSLPCTVCGKPAQFTCSYCVGNVFYCSQTPCQINDWPNHSKTCKYKDKERPDIRIQDRGERTIANLQELDADETAQDLKFYIEQLYLITVPVFLCIILSIFWVKITSDPRNGTTLQSAYAYITPAEGDSAQAQAVNGLVQALIIIGNLIVMTIIIVLCVRYRCIKALTYFFGFTITMLLGYFGFIIWFQLFDVWNLPLDIVSMIFGLWNFTVVGIIVIFWKSPKALRQLYLIIMCSIMAYVFTGVPEWTTWILLGLLVIWDLVAVLCPFGPLKLLIEHAREQPDSTRPMQALLYSAMLYTEDLVYGPVPVTDASKDAQHTKQSTVDSGFIVMEALTDLHQPMPITCPTNKYPQKVYPNRDNSGTGTEPNAGENNNGEAQQPDNSYEMTQKQPTGGNHGNGSPTKSPTERKIQFSQEARKSEERKSSRNSQQPPSPYPAAEQYAEGDEEEDDDDDERSGLKLGLGDFVFYSVLIARAAMFDWITTVTCVVAIFTGLDATIFLLALFRKALPALPISLTFGIVFYFVARIMLVPYFSAEGLVQLQNSVTATGEGLNSPLLVGEYQGSMIMI